jgi:hypothetical protein
VSGGTWKGKTVARTREKAVVICDSRRTHYSYPLTIFKIARVRTRADPIELTGCQCDDSNDWYRNPASKVLLVPDPNVREASSEPASHWPRAGRCAQSPQTASSSAPGPTALSGSPPSYCRWGFAHHPGNEPGPPSASKARLCSGEQSAVARSISYSAPMVARARSAIGL